MLKAKEMPEVSTVHIAAFLSRDAITARSCSMRKAAHILLSSQAPMSAEMDSSHGPAVGCIQSYQFCTEQSCERSWHLQICTEVITGSADAAMEVRFFAAQTLSHKVRRQLQSLSSSDKQALQRSLISCLAASSSSPLAILSQLCTAMASLIVQFVNNEDAVSQLGEILLHGKPIEAQGIGIDNSLSCYWVDYLAFNFDKGTLCSILVYYCV